MRNVTFTDREFYHMAKYRLYVEGPDGRQFYVVKISNYFDILFGKQCFALFFTLDAAYELARSSPEYKFKLEKVEASHVDNPN